MSTSIIGVAGWGFDIPEELSGLEGDIDFLPDAVLRFKVEGFHAVLCRDYTTGFPLVLLIMSNHHDMSRDVKPVREWIDANFPAHACDGSPNYVGGFLVRHTA